MKKILIVSPSWVGDMVMAQSLFKLLKQQDATNRLHVLAPAWTFSLTNRMPEVSHAVEMPFAHGEVNLRARYALAKQLQAEKYDQAIVLPNSFKAALIPWLAGIPKRTGWLGESRYFVLNDARKLDKKRYPLMVEQYVALGLPKDSKDDTVYPKPEFLIPAIAQKQVLQQFNLSTTHKAILAICPGAEFGPSKRWLPEYFAQVAREKLNIGWEVWIFGSPKDKAITDEVMQLTQNGCKNLSGRTTLAETIDLLSCVSGMVTNDSGLMHVAAALKKPLIAVYGSTSPAFTPPLSDKAIVLQKSLPCQPCFSRNCPLEHHQCMRDITPAQVLSAMDSWGIS